MRPNSVERDVEATATFADGATTVALRECLATLPE
jgi:hypothetical protein